MFAIGRAFEAITDPLIGALSDRTTLSFGRRRTWMAIGVPIAMVATWFLLTPQPGNSALYLLVWLLVLVAGWTMVFIRTRPGAASSAATTTSARASRAFARPARSSAISPPR